MSAMAKVKMIIQKLARSLDFATRAIMDTIRFCVPARFTSIGIMGFFVDIADKLFHWLGQIAVRFHFGSLSAIFVLSIIKPTQWSLIVVLSLPTARRSGSYSGILRL